MPRNDLLSAAIAENPYGKFALSSCVIENRRESNAACWIDSPGNMNLRDLDGRSNVT
jgi:hypothetical protein